MKNKKLIIIISTVVVVLLIAITSICIILFNNSVIGTITLDINPSIELELGRGNKVLKVTPLNDDAKKVLDDDLNGKDLKLVLSRISNKVASNGFVNDGNVQIIMSYKGSIDKNNINQLLTDSFNELQMHAEIINIDNITKEDEELAKKYNITPAKAAYINSIAKEKDVKIEDLKDKPVNELVETKMRGLYCDEGYFLEGDHCFKKIGVEEPVDGEICPREYNEYNGKCYKEVRIVETGNIYCASDFTLEGKKCIRDSEMDAQPVCPNNEMQDNKCVEKEFIGDATEYCRDPGRTLYQHKCLATKPTINGGCLGSDFVLNGKCVNPIDDYYASEWMCPDGQTNSRPDGSLLNSDNKCYNTKLVEPKEYKCEDEAFTLKDKKCYRRDTQEPFKEYKCENGATLIDNNRCYVMTDVKEKESGKVCKSETARFENDTCNVYEIIEAHNAENKK